jgi:hypothetical protein
LHTLSKHWINLVGILCVLIVLPKYGISEEQTRKNNISSNKDIEILKYELVSCPSSVGIRITVDKSTCMKILYKAVNFIDKTSVDSGFYKVIADCFDSKKEPLEGFSKPVNEYEALSPGEVRNTVLTCPPGTAHFNIRVYSPWYKR